MIRRREFIAGLGGAAAWPVVARAQRPKMPIIGYLNGTTGANQRFAAAFRQGLSDLGYVEGQSVSIEYYWMGGQYDRLAAPAADLVRRQVSALGGPQTHRVVDGQRNQRASGSPSQTMRRASPTSPSEKRSPAQQQDRHAPARARRRHPATTARSRPRYRSLPRGTAHTSGASHRSVGSS
jgi:hypothetical protein